MTESAPRPRQVTVASIIAGLGAVLVLINIFAVMSDWGSASVREEVENALDDGPFGPASISVETALEMLRIMLMIVAAGCVAAVVFAVYTVRRHRAARIGLTVLAGAWALLSLALGLAGLLLAVIAVGCVVLLWSAEARKWFATSTPTREAVPGEPPIPPPPHTTSAKGMPIVMSTPPPSDEPDQPKTWGKPNEESSAPPRGDTSATPPPPPSQPGPPPPPPPPPSQPGPPPPPPSQPGGYSGYGQPPAGGYQPYSAYAPATPPPAPESVVPTKRPGTLTAAGVITIVMSSFALLGSGILGLVFLADRNSLEEDESMTELANDADVAVEDLVTALGILGIIAALLSLAALVLGVLLLRNKRVRIPLVVLSAIAIIMSLLAFPIGLLWVIAEILVIVFCFIGGAGAWFDAQGYAADRARQQR
ncbi:MAG: hypothetical protein ACRDQD_22300 [Nocardioidaceae bacterium]